MVRSYSVSEIASLLGLDFQGEGSQAVTRLSGWEDAGAGSLVFLEGGMKPLDVNVLVGATCILGPRNLIPGGCTAIFSDRPKLHFARAGALLNPAPAGGGRHHESAAIAPDAAVAENVDIGPFVTVAPGARIGAGTIVHPGVVVGEGALVGERCILHPRVVLYPGVQLGNRVILHAGVVIGGDGFGYVFDGRDQIKFPQTGRLEIEDDVEVGAGTTIDRGSLGTTRIGRGTKIDNLVQIAHNVQIGEGVVIAAQTGISGSTVIEDFAVIGGQVGFGDHTRVQKGAVIGSKAGVLPGKIVRSGEVYWGVPVRPLREYKRLNALFGRLPDMKSDIDTLKRAVSQLQSALRELEARAPEE